MADKRPAEEVDEELSGKRPCVKNTNFTEHEVRSSGLDSPSNVIQLEEQLERAEALPEPSSCESQASSSASSSSRADAESSSEGSVADSLDMGLGDIQPDNLPGPMGWLRRQMMTGVNPRSILMRILPSGMSIPEEMDEFEMWSIIAEYLRSIDDPPPRQKLEQYNTFQDAIQLLQSCRNILVLTGAGVSVSCGIPDFRSRDGVYARLAVDFPDLPDPQAMFDIGYFRKDPRPFFKFAKELFPGQFKPSTSHHFISQLQQHNKLLRNYTQNIDTLEQAAGITRVIQCHGSFATATCTRCSYTVDCDTIRTDVFNQVVPVCPQCGPGTGDMAVLKPDIVFFGEGLPNHFYDKLEDDKQAADLLIVMGSSLKVRPVATIPILLPKNVPQILINRETLSHMNFDIELLGDCDVIINEILHRLGDGWNHTCQSKQRLTETCDIPDMPGPEKKEDSMKDKLETPATVEGDESETKDGVCMVSDKSQVHDEDKRNNFMEDAPVNESHYNNGLPVETSHTDPDVKDSKHNTQHCISAVSKAVKMERCDSGCLDAESEESRNKRLGQDRGKHKGVNDSLEAAASELSQDSGLQDSSGDQESLLSQRTMDLGAPCPHNGVDSDATKSHEYRHTSEEAADTLPHVCERQTSSASADSRVGDSSTSVPSELHGETAGPGGGESVGDEAGHASLPEHRPASSSSATELPRRESIATYLKGSSFLFIPPNRYVFHGAEFYPASDDDNDDNDLENGQQPSEELWSSSNVVLNDHENGQGHSEEQGWWSSNEDLNVHENGHLPSEEQCSESLNEDPSDREDRQVPSKERRPSTKEARKDIEKSEQWPNEERCRPSSNEARNDIHNHSSPSSKDITNQEDI